MANIARLEALADWIETNVTPEQFYFGDFWNGVAYSPDQACGTVACLCGWAPAVFPELQQAWNKSLHYSKFNSAVVQVFLDLSTDDFHRLFLPGDECDGLSGLQKDASLADAIFHLRWEIEQFKTELTCDPLTTRKT